MNSNFTFVKNRVYGKVSAIKQRIQKCYIDQVSLENTQEIIILAH